MTTPNIPDYPQGQPWYLSSITHALYLDEPSGNVVLRTGFQGNIIITGNVNIPGTVTVNSSPADPVHTHVSEVGTSGILTTPYMPVGGNVNAAVSGTVSIQDGGNSITVDGNVGITGNITGITALPPITGNVNASVTGNVTVVDGGGSITVDGNVGVTGNVNIGAMPNVNATITGGNVNAAVSGNVGISSLGNIDISGTEMPITGNVTATLASGASVSVNGFTNGLADAFGRLRVSNPVTLFDTQARYYDHAQFSTSTSGSANVVYNANSSSYLCNVGAATGDSVLRETVRVFPYQPGKSLLIYQSFCFNLPKPNLRQRVGYFDADNGIFFEVNGITLNMVIRSSSSGAIIEDRIPQSSWNVDTLNGAGGSSNPSGIALNPSLNQIWFCDVEWLGVGTVRVGFIINGQYITCHEFHHANIPSTGTANNTTTYMTTANLPLRLEITNTGITGSNSTLRQICASVISEGGFQLSGSGNPRAASHIIGNPVRLPNDASFLPVMSIRLKSTMLDAIVIPTAYTLVPVAQSMFQFRIYKYAVTSGGTWVDSAPDSAVQYNLSPTALVSGSIVEQSFINSTNQSSGAPTQEGFSFSYQLEREPFSGVPYEYVIMMATTGTNQDVYASIEWQEFS